MHKRVVKRDQQERWNQVAGWSVDDTGQNLRSLKGELYHSEMGARNEAKALWEGVGPEPILILFGSGLGEVILQGKEWLEEHPSKRLVILEPEEGAIQQVIEQEGLDHDQVLFLSYGESDVSFLYYLLVGLGVAPWQFRYLPSFENDPRLLTLMKDLQTAEGLFRKEAENFEPGPRIHNCYMNLSNLLRALDGDELKERFSGTPAVIVGAGASVLESKEQLKKLEDRALVIGVGTGLNVLGELGVRPHLAVGCDPYFRHYATAAAQQMYEVPYVINTRIDQRVPHLAPQLLVHMKTEDKGFGTLLSDESRPLPWKGNSVTTFALQLALHMGCGPIYLVGTDFSYEKEKPYPFKNLHHPYFSKDPRCKEVSSREIPLDGGGRWTTPQFLEEMRWISTMAETSRSKIKIVSNEAPDIPGTEKATLDELDDALVEKNLRGRVLAEVVQLPPSCPSRRLFEEKLDQVVVSLEKVLLLTKQGGQILEECSVAPEKRCDFLEVEFERLSLKIQEEFFFKQLLSDAYITFQLFLKARRDFWGMQPLEEKRAFLNFIRECGVCHLEGLKKLAEVLANQKEEEIDIELYNEWVQKAKEASEGLQKELVYGKNGECLSFVHYEGNVKEGIQVDYFGTGSFAKVSHYKAGQLEGPLLLFSKGHRLLAKMHFQEGKLDGKVELYYPNGKLMRELYYKQGAQDGVEQFFLENGQRLFKLEWKSDRT